MTLEELIEKYIEFLKTQKGYSNHTIRNYRIDLNQFVEFFHETGGDGEGERPCLEAPFRGISTLNDCSKGLSPQVLFSLCGEDGVH